MTEKSNTPKEHKDCWRTPPEIFNALNAEFCTVTRGDLVNFGSSIIRGDR